MTDIVITDITTGAVDGSGVFDKLMVAVKSHITEEYDNGRIKGSDYANVYLGALQGVLTQSVEYVLREKLTEAQIIGIEKDNELKESQIIGSGYDNQVKEQQVAESEFRVDFLLPKELEKISADIIGSGYDNEVKEQQVLESKYKVEELLPAELLQLQKQVDVAERGMVEQELTGAKQRDVLYVERVIKDKEAATLGLDKVVSVANTPATTEAVYIPKYEGV